MRRLLPKIEGFVGIPGPEVYQMKKWIRPTSTLAPYINSTSKSEVFPIWGPLPNPKELKASLSKYKLSNSFFKMQLQNCVFPNFNLQILSSTGMSNFRSSFANLFNFKFTKFCWISPKSYKRSVAHSEKMS